MSLLLVFLLLSCTALSVSEFLPPVIQPLALGALRPAGWLQAVLEVQLSGQTGSLPRFWCATRAHTSVPARPALFTNVVCTR